MTFDARQFSVSTWVVLDDFYLFLPEYKWFKVWLIRKTEFCGRNTCVSQFPLRTESNSTRPVVTLVVPRVRYKSFPRSEIGVKIERDEFQEVGGLRVYLFKMLLRDGRGGSVRFLKTQQVLLPT